MRKTTYLKFLLLNILLLGAGSMYAETYSYTFTEQVWSGDGAQTLAGIDWTAAALGAGYWGYDTNNTPSKGQQFGSSKAPATSLVLSTAGFPGTITSVKVTTSGASGLVATLGVSVGGNAYLPATVDLSTTSTPYEFVGTSSGQLVLTWTPTALKAIYIAAIEVTYTTGTVEPNPPTILVTEVMIPEMRAEVNETETKPISVSGVNLTSSITMAVSGPNASYFTVSPTTIPQSGGSVEAAEVVVTYAPLAQGTHTATLTFSSTGANDVVRALTGIATTPPVQGATPNVIISEVYGGGGNGGAVLKNDFVELYNTTASAVNIGGWSVQYYSAAGTSPSATNIGVIPDGKVIPANGYFLIEASAGTGGTDDLPTPDAVSTLNMSGSAGKAILFTTADAQTISDITSITGNPAFKDYVPFGTTAVPIWGSAMESNLTSTTSASRKKVGSAYSYTQNIGFDFEAVTPTPTSSGMTSVNKPTISFEVVAVNGTLRFEAKAGQKVEVYNVIGQKLVNKVTNDGYNIIPLKEKGMMVVRIGNKVSKVIL